jgi:hypothetical protein
VSHSSDAKDADTLKQADATVDVSAIENDGTEKLSVGFAAPKDSSIDFNMTMKLKTAGRTLTAEATSVERQKD